MEKIKRFGMTLSEAEKNAILDLAEEAGGLSMSALVRRVIRNAALEKGVWSKNQIRSGSEPAVETYTTGDHQCQ